MTFLEELAARRRFGMKPGLESIRTLLSAMGNPHALLPCLHVAGTNGKGAVCAFLDAALQAAGFSVGRYTSPHLMRLNERFFWKGSPLSDAELEVSAYAVEEAAKKSKLDLTFFEALTAVAFHAYQQKKPDFLLLETGLGGRLDATNVCSPRLTLITRVGLDHCDWLGDTLEKIATEKAGIIKPHVPVILGCNASVVQAVVSARAREVGAPYFYAPDLVPESEVPSSLALPGAFNRENARTAWAALKILAENVHAIPFDSGAWARGFAAAVWPGRFQSVGAFLVDGAHNPPAAKALAAALAESYGPPARQWALIAGFCGDKDVDTVLKTLATFVAEAYAIRTSNPRSLSADETARHLQAAKIPARAEPSLAAALASTQSFRARGGRVLICGSLFLAGEALVELNAFPWDAKRCDPSELLKVSQK